MKPLRTIGSSISYRLRQNTPSLVDKYEFLVEQCWHPHNVHEPHEVSPGSELVVKWYCLNEPEHRAFWARICDRVRSFEHNTYSQSCAVCGHLSKESNSQPLPERLRKEWLREKNGFIPASWVNARSNMLAYWRCTKGAHVFRAKVSERFAGQDCPSCFSGERHNLPRYYPDIFALYQHRAKNLGYSYRQLPGNHKVYWQCLDNPKHEWYASFQMMLLDALCPKCNLWHIDLREYPNLFIEFERSKNKGVDPCEIVRSTELIHWRCKAGEDHRWSATVEKRVFRGDGCPYCSGRRISESNSLFNHPLIAAEWHISRNGTLTPSDVKASDRQRHWWTCSRCHHEWQQSPYSRVTSEAVNCSKCRRASIADD
jgi:hypothetical protein